MSLVFAKSSLMIPRMLETGESAWIGHVPFALWMIDFLAPGIVVELGTYYGFSYFAFCQGVQENKLDSRCFAVDTWKGDEHGGFYDDSVFRCVSEYNTRNYNLFSKLLRMDFDAATSGFEDGTIDLLHIDGFHTYESVKHDFERWLPKLSPRGVVLFHDIAVRERGFGVWRLWEELALQFPHMEFSHSYGLGVLFVGKERSESIGILLEEWADPAKSELIKRYFERLGRLVELEYTISRSMKNKSRDDARIVELTQDLHSKDAQIVELTQDLQSKKTQIKRIQNSLSWRITQPLRRVGRIRKLFKP